jgi:hypothetical protein
MAERLEFDTPTAPPAADGERKLEFDPVSREKQLRAEYGKEIAQRGEPGYGERFIDAATYGASRPLSGAARVVGGLFDPNSTAGERWRAGVGAAGDYFKKGEENTAGPGGFATDVAGALAAPPIGKVASLGKAAVTGGRDLLAKLVGKAAVTSAEKKGAGAVAQATTAGALEGAARNAEDVGSAVEGAETGGALGGTVAKAIGGASKLFPGVRGAEKEARVAARGESPEEIKKVTGDIYKQIDNAGIAYAQPQTATLKQGIDDLISTNQYNKIAHSKISGYVDELSQKAQEPGGMKFTDLHNLRSAIAKEARGPDASTREAAGKINAEIDKLVQGNAPAVNPNNLDLKEIYPRISKLWRGARLADDVGYLGDKAERKAASKSGVNPDEANRAAFRPMLETAEKPGAYSPYKGTSDAAKEQRDLLAKIVQGDTLQNTYRNAGAVAGSPIARALVGLATGAAGFSHGGIGGGLGGYGVGSAGSGAAKALLDRAAANRGAENIDKLIRHITTGSTDPSTRAPSQEALAILRRKELAQRAGGAYGGSLTGEK